MKLYFQKPQFKKCSRCRKMFFRKNTEKLTITTNFDTDNVCDKCLKI